MGLAEVRRIAVIGAGTMGAGIAQACAAAGFQVAMRDIEQRLVDGGFRRIREPLAKRVEKGKMTAAEVDGILGKIRGVVNLKDAVTGAQVTASLRLTTPRIFPRMPSTSAAVIFPFSTRFASGSRIRRKPPSTRRCSMSRIATWKPAAAHACAIPAPIVPAPITAIFRTSARPMAPPAAAEYPCGPKECVT